MALSQTLNSRYPDHDIDIEIGGPEMLKITIPGIEQFDDEKEEFLPLTKEQTLQLEHSLVSLSKWESKWCKPFLSKVEKTDEETIDYIQCMTLTQHVDQETYHLLTRANKLEITNYIEAPMTATIFSKDGNSKTKEIITAEIIYYWMISMNIPFECQKWHLNRLLTLINVCNLKNQPPKKLSQREIINRNRALNDTRRKSLNTTG
jgi:hypothetical protein